MFKDSVYSQFIFKSRYARWIEKEGRREDWPETVERYFDFMQGFMWDNNSFDMSSIRSELEKSVLNHDIMPSMRALMTAGRALDRDNVCSYNCAYIPIDSLKAFDEMMYILMSGTGVGYSVENESIKQLPEVPDQLFHTDTTVVFEDSKLGWAKGFREFIALLSSGHIPKYDTSKLRPSGAKLKIMGGRSSGPQPLIDLLEFVKIKFINAAGRKLTDIECHDIACKIGDIVVVGGVRRSALICLSDLDSRLMSKAKSGQWYVTNPYRRLANNSAIYEYLPDTGTFMKEWLSLYESKSGERGIFNRLGIKNVIKNSNSFREALSRATGISLVLRKLNDFFGTNPCSEIILLPDQFCNLTSVQIYEDDTIETLTNKVRLATILGTFQSCLTNFKYINKKWQRNCEEERLLGVSLNGIYDNKITNGTSDYNLSEILVAFKETAILTNKEWADKVGINQSVAVTAVKPEGTTSAFCGTASGIHPDHAPFYIRYVRNDLKDPLTQFMIDKGVPYEKDAYDPANVVSFKFPIKASKNAIFKKDVSAIEHLNLWMTYQMFYTEHKPSITVSVKESEWMEVGAWLFKNFDYASGIAFLPAEESDTIYKQAPFTTCTEQEYETLLSQMPKEIDWSGLSEYEVDDATKNAQTLACVGSDGCLI